MSGAELWNILVGGVLKENDLQTKAWVHLTSGENVRPYKRAIPGPLVCQLNSLSELSLPGIT